MAIEEDGTEPSVERITSQEDRRTSRCKAANELTQLLLRIILRVQAPLSVRVISMY